MMKRVERLVTATIILCIWAMPSFAQTIVAEHYGPADGAVRSAIVTIDGNRLYIANTLPSSVPLTQLDANAWLLSNIPLNTKTLWDTMATERADEGAIVRVPPEWGSYVLIENDIEPRTRAAIRTTVIKVNEQFETLLTALVSTNILTPAQAVAILPLVTITKADFVETFRAQKNIQVQ